MSQMAGDFLALATSSDEIWVREFDEDAVEKFQSQVKTKFAEDSTKPVILNINSYGGSVDGLFAMLDIMDYFRGMSQHPAFGFITQAYGKAFSAGAVLLAYGDYRFASKNTRIMLHQAVGSAGGPYGSPFLDVQTEFQEFNRVNDRVLDVLQAKCQFRDREQIKEYLTQDRYMSAVDALHLGVVDAVGCASIEEVKGFQIQVVDPYSPKKERKNVGDRQKDNGATEGAGKDSTVPKAPGKRPSGKGRSGKGTRGARK